MTHVDQSGAVAGGDNVAGSKTTNISTTTIYQSDDPSIVSVARALMRRLTEEVRSDNTTKERVEALQFYYERLSVDGVDGLEAKLDKAGRGTRKRMALRQKEEFVKLLNKFAYYPSAQQIFAFLLSKIHNKFDCLVEPYLSSLSPAEVDQLILDALLMPLIDELGDGEFHLNANLVFGMLYWLAEQCYVRWHA